MNKAIAQRGFSFMGFLFVAGLVAFFLILGMKLVPSYLEYMNVKKAIAGLKGMPEKEARKAFYNRAIMIDDVKSVKPDDLEFSKAGVSVEWHVNVPLIANLSACIDFKASTIEEGEQK